MEQDKFIVVVTGIVFNPSERKILIGKAKGDKEWSFLESDLSYEIELDKALKQSAKEKTGYTIKNLGAVFAQNCINPQNKMTLYFLCEISKGREELGKNIEEIKWISPSETEKYLGKQLPTRLKEYIMNLG